MRKTAVIVFLLFVLSSFAFYKVLIEDHDHPDWQTLAYLKPLEIERDCIMARGYPPGSMARWTGAGLGPDHSAGVEYLSGAGAFELGVRDVKAEPGMAFTDNFDRNHGALGDPWRAQGVEIHAKAVRPVSTEAAGFATFRNARIEADQFAAFKVTKPGGRVSAVVRGDVSGGFKSGYIFTVDTTSAGMEDRLPWRLSRMAHGASPTVLDSGIIEVGVKAPARELYLVVKGGNLVTLWGVWGNRVVFRYQDGSEHKIQSGYPGLDFGKDGFNLRVDDWNCGSIRGTDQRYWMWFNTDLESWIGWSLDTLSQDGSLIHNWSILKVFKHAQRSGDRFRLQVNGDTISLYINDALAASAIDDLIPANVTGSAPALGIFSTSISVCGWEARRMQ